MERKTISAVNGCPELVIPVGVLGGVLRSRRNLHAFEIEQPTFKDTIMIKDRAVEVIIEAPAGQNVLNVRELAEKSWPSVNKSITINGVTMKVRSFRR